MVGILEMSEPDPTYTATIDGAKVMPYLSPPAPECLKRFYELERERTIARLRDLDRLLRRPQTIPERQR